jgi:hypothetical protein
MRTWGTLRVILIRKGPNFFRSLLRRREILSGQADRIEERTGKKECRPAPFEMTGEEKGARG